MRRSVWASGWSVGHGIMHPSPRPQERSVGTSPLQRWVYLHAAPTGVHIAEQRRRRRPKRGAGLGTVTHAGGGTMVRVGEWLQ